MSDEKMTCPHCQGEMDFQVFMNCFDQEASFFKCMSCGFALDKKDADRLKRRKAKAA